jgi:hypothetical protein
MTVKDTEIRKTFTPVFESFGINAFSIHKRGKHPHLIFEHAGREHRIPISGTPSDYRAQQNKISFLKRYIRNINDSATLH